MKAAFIEKPGAIALREIPAPVVADDEVLIEVKASGICGTDIHIFRGEYLGTYPVIPGHEFSGVVTAIGARVTRFKPGDRVAVEPNISCDNCAACLSNHQNFCEKWNGIGVTLPGGMAQLVAVPEKAAFNIGTLPFAAGAFVEPLSCVLHGVQRTGFSLADRVLILGAGPIGILLLKAILLEGASIATVLWKVIVPLAAPGIAITAVLSWVFAWNEYLFAATLTSVRARTVTTGLAEFVTVTGTNWGEMAAISVVSLLPALIFLALVQRYIVTGLTFGAVKG